jgi:transposase
MPKRRTFTPQFKSQVVLSLLTGTKSMAQVCREHGLKDQVVTRWKIELIERAPELFGAAGEREQYLERIAQLEGLVGRLTLELEVAKKASQLFSSELSRNDR